MLTANERPIHLALSTAIAFTSVILIGFSVMRYSDYERNSEDFVKHENAQKLLGNIELLNGQLTMSALMAAQTGDLQWEERYRRDESKLATLLSDESTGLQGTHLAKNIKNASDDLGILEHLALQSVSEGHLAEAQAILTNKAYLDKKMIYRSEIENLNAKIRAQMELSDNQNKKNALLGIAFFFLASAGLILAWLKIAQLLLSLRTTLARKNQDLEAISTRLSNINFSLDVRVAERTKELEHAQRNLLHLQKTESLGTIAGGIAHDLNNQLTPVRGYLELVLARDDLNEKQRNYITEAYNAAERCINIVKRISKFSKRTNDASKPFKPESVYNEVLGMLPQILPSSLKVNASCEANLWYINGNETELQSVVVNLIVNARDAMPNGGNLDVSFANVDLAKDGTKQSTHQKYVVVTVKDTGTGMSEEVMAQIFEPFFTTKESSRGTGLGLSMAYGTIKAMNGWIDVSSKPNEGTKFQIFVPAYFDQPEEAGKCIATSSDGRPNSATQKGTILFVDDEEVIRSLGKMFLENFGYEVLLAEDGAQAMEIYKKNPKAIFGIVSDMLMPNMGGYDLLNELRKLNKNAKVIIASGFANEEATEKLFSAGALEVLNKPFTLISLGDAVNKHFETSQS